MATLYLTRSQNGHLLLHQRKPRNFSKRKLWTLDRFTDSGFSIGHYERKHSDFPIFQYGHIFRINEFPGSETLSPSNNNLTMIEVELFVPQADEKRYQDLWVTKTEDSRFVLHHSKPKRVKDWDDYIQRHFNVYKKNRWHSLKGQCYIKSSPEFIAIDFEDIEPTPVEIKIKNKKSEL